MLRRRSRDRLERVVFSLFAQSVVAAYDLRTGLCTANSKMLRKLTIRHAQVFLKALEKANLRHVRIHDLRHTFASHLVQAGESLSYVQQQMGHSSIQVTADVYAHLIPGANRAAVDRLDAIPAASDGNPGATGEETKETATAGK